MHIAAPRNKAKINREGKHRSIKATFTRTDASLWLAWGRFLRSFAFLRGYLVVLVYRGKDRH